MDKLTDVRETKARAVSLITGQVSFFRFFGKLRKWEAWAVHQIRHDVQLAAGTGTDSMLVGVLPYEPETLANITPTSVADFLDSEVGHQLMGFKMIHVIRTVDSGTNYLKVESTYLKPPKILVVNPVLTVFASTLTNAYQVFTTLLYSRIKLSQREWERYMQLYGAIQSTRQ